MSTTAGIDIGSEAIKGVVLKAAKNGAIEVVGAGTMPVADLTRMSDSPDRALAIGEKLRELVRSARLRAETRRVGASGGRTSIRYLQIPPVPPWRLEMLVKYEVEERAEEKEANCSDYHIMDVPESNGQYTVMIGMCRESYAEELLGQAKAGKLGEVEIDLEALALYSAYYHGHGFDTDKTVAIADIGADDLTVLICKNGALYYARTLLGGGRRFTQNLSDDLKLDWSEADDLKKTSAEIVFDATPAASSTGRTRLQRTGGTLSIPRANMPGKPGASAAVPGVPPADAGAASGAGAAGARSGVVPAPAAGGNGDETRRARVPDGTKMLLRPGPGQAGQPGGSQVKPGVPSAGGSGTSPVARTHSNSGAPATPGNPAATQKLPAPMFKMSGELESLEDLELDFTPAAPSASSVAPAASQSAPAAPGAPAASGAQGVQSAPSASAVPASKPAVEALDDFELQPAAEEKKDQPKAGASKAAPGMTPAVAPPKVTIKPAPRATASTETIELVSGDGVKDPLEETSAAAGASTIISVQDMQDASQSVSIVPASADDKDRRKRQITAALVREAAVLCAAVENVMLNAKQQAKQPQMKLDRLYITGGGSKLKGLPEFMARRLRVEVQPMEPLRNLSLARLSPAAADALRAEQHTFGVALGLALSDLRRGAFNFVLLPQALKNRREFWARGAYHYYAAGAAALALGLLVYTPYVNTDALNENFTRADEAFKLARTKNEEVKRSEKDNSELRHRLKTIGDNVQSGDYFLNLLAELKSKSRIQDDIYLTSISTSMPNVVMAEAKDEKVDVKPPGMVKESDSFLAQRRVYLRGFARGKQKESLIKPIQDFYDKLVPYPTDPDNPANLFKDIRAIWISKEDNLKDGLYLKEFVLEAYTAAAAKDAVKTDAAAPKGAGDKKNVKPGSKTVPGTPLAPAAVPAQPAPPAVRRLPPPAVQVEQGQVRQTIPAPDVIPGVPAPPPNPANPVGVVPPQPNVLPATPAPTVPGNQNPVVAPPKRDPLAPVPVRPGQAPVQVPAQVNPPAVPDVQAPRRKPVYVVPDEPAVAPAKNQNAVKQ